MWCARQTWIFGIVVGLIVGHIWTVGPGVAWSPITYWQQIQNLRDSPWTMFNSGLWYMLEEQRWQMMAVGAATASTVVGWMMHGPRGAVCFGQSTWKMLHPNAQYRSLPQGWTDNYGYAAQPAHYALPMPMPTQVTIPPQYLPAPTADQSAVMLYDRNQRYQPMMTSWQHQAQPWVQHAPQQPMLMPPTNPMTFLPHEMSRLPIIRTIPTS